MTKCAFTFHKCVLCSDKSLQLQDLIVALATAIDTTKHLPNSQVLDSNHLASACSNSLPIVCTGVACKDLGWFVWGGGGGKRFNESFLACTFFLQFFLIC